jgi:hypothetical protein
VSWPLLFVVLSWSTLLFGAYGLRSRANATVITMIAFGAFSVASAIFLILALSQPYTGILRLPGDGLSETIEALGP